MQQPCGAFVAFVHAESCKLTRPSIRFKCAPRVCIFGTSLLSGKQKDRGQGLGMEAVEWRGDSRFAWQGVRAERSGDKVEAGGGSPSNPTKTFCLFRAT